MVEEKKKKGGIIKVHLVADSAGQGKAERGGRTHHVVIVQLVARKTTWLQLHLELRLRRWGRLVMVDFFGTVLKFRLVALLLVLELLWEVLLLLVRLLVLQSCPPRVQVLLGELVETNV